MKNLILRYGKLNKDKHTSFIRVQPLLTIFLILWSWKLIYSQDILKWNLGPKVLARGKVTLNYRLSVPFPFKKSFRETFESDTFFKEFCISLLVVCVFHAANLNFQQPTRKGSSGSQTRGIDLQIYGSSWLRSHTHGGKVCPTSKNHW